MKNNKIAYYLLLLLAAIVLSCTNDLNKIKKISYDPNSPDEVSQKLNIYYVDSGYAKLNIFALHAETYSKQNLTKLKDSIQVDFFDDNGTITTTLTARYGEVDNKSGKIFVKDSVKLVNHADKRIMYTTILYWNQADSTIYTDQDVKLVSPKGVGYGTSLRAKQDFTTYKITDPRGAYEFNQ